MSSPTRPEQEALFEVQRMLEAGASPDALRAYVAQRLARGPASPPPSLVGSAEPAGGSSRVASFIISIPSAPLNAGVGTGGCGTPHPLQTFTLASVVAPSSSPPILQQPHSSSGPFSDLTPTVKAHPPHAPSAHFTVPELLASNNGGAGGGSGSMHSSNLSQAAVATPISGRVAPAAGLSPGPTPPVMGAAASVVRPAARKEISAYMDGSFTRVPMPRRHNNGGRGSSTSPASVGAVSPGWSRRPAGHGASFHSGHSRAGAAAAVPVQSPNLSRRDQQQQRPQSAILSLEHAIASPNKPEDALPANSSTGVRFSTRKGGAGPLLTVLDVSSTSLPVPSAGSSNNNPHHATITTTPSATVVQTSPGYAYAAESPMFRVANASTGILAGQQLSTGDLLARSLPGGPAFARRTAGAAPMGSHLYLDTIANNGGDHPHHQHQQRTAHRRPSFADSLALLEASCCSSVDGSIDSGLPTGRSLAGFSSFVSSASRLPRGGHVTAHSGGYGNANLHNGPTAALNIRRRNSILNVTARNSQLHTDGAGGNANGSGGGGQAAAPAGEEAAGGSCGPRFARMLTRDSEAHVALTETRRALAALGVPFIPELHYETAGPRGTNTTATTGSPTGPYHDSHHLHPRTRSNSFPSAHAGGAPTSDDGFSSLGDENRQYSTDNAASASGCENLHYQTGIAAPHVDSVALARQYGTEMFIYVAMNVFLRYSFISTFGFDSQKLLNFMSDAFTFFRPGNPHHHPIHAADIIVAAHQWLCQPTVSAHLTDEETLAFLFSAAVMRVGHSGIDNRLLTQMKHPYAMMCSYAAPQQGATVALVMALLEKSENRFFPCIFHTRGFEDSLDDSSRSASEEDEGEDGDGGAMRRARALPANASSLPSLPDTTTAPTATAPAHQWTQFREYQFFDLISELVLATDERNHFQVKASVTSIREDHFHSHGCLCPLKAHASGEPYEERYATLACRKCCAYVSDAHVPDVLKAVLHFIDVSFLLRPFDVFITVSVAVTAELYRWSECQSHLFAATERLQKIAARHARRRTTREPAAAAAAGGRQGGSLFCGSADSPPMDLRTRPESADGSGVTTADMARAFRSGSAASSAALVPPPEAEADEDLLASSVRAERALLEASGCGLWREDALHSSTLSTLRAIEGLPTPLQQLLLLPPAHGGGRARTRLLCKTEEFRRLSGDSTDSSGSAPTPPRSSFQSAAEGMPAFAARKSITHPHLASSTTGVGAGVGGEGVAGAASAPRHPLQGHGRDILLVSIEDMYYPLIAELGPYLPRDWGMNGVRNHARLLTELPTVEEYDLLVEKFLYNTRLEPEPEEDEDGEEQAAAGGPSSTSAGSNTISSVSNKSAVNSCPNGNASKGSANGGSRIDANSNHHHNNHKSDAASELGADSLPTAAELRKTVPLAKYIPYELLARLIPPQPHWHFDEDGLESRVLAAITQAGSQWVSFGAMAKALRTADAAERSAAAAAAAAGGGGGGGSRRASDRRQRASRTSKVVGAAADDEADHVPVESTI